ncbi:hypothetical protein CC1G_12630 [Coprinopsis cinerea okayama7|uniref:Uncharacterized protein n=1 Tax=Coprinopsis cinerea (strain Okayama-7 / 130 / ATCC MYA-4618 / FGSC 9003) TaxID=240176 RepID=A8NSZ9_COPC7|nr:hypothetical protein CC1G_12630 [Coprinopsis cinerea okayama7\|eukprot:XP_001836126.2 hypothetical protein CC1G_12630 [Coprinopsis cinerea okayama7\
MPPLSHTRSRAGFLPLATFTNLRLLQGILRVVLASSRFRLRIASSSLSHRLAFTWHHPSVEFVRPCSFLLQHFLEPGQNDL